MKNNVKKQYLKELKAGIGKMTDVKRVFLTEITTDINEYLSANKDADINTLYEKFGSPEEIAQQFYSIKDISALNKKARKYVILRIIAIVMFIAIVILVIDFIASTSTRYRHHITIGNDFQTTSVISPLV